MNPRGEMYRVIYRVDEEQARTLILAVIHGKRLLVRDLIIPPAKPN